VATPEDVLPPRAPAAHLAHLGAHLPSRHASRAPSAPGRDAAAVGAAVGSGVAPSIAERRGSFAFLSHLLRAGEWSLPREFRGLAVMGNLELDLTRARIAPGTSHLELRSIMGSVTVRVPHHLRVECEGDPFIGSVDVRRKAPPIAAPDAPLLRITATAVLGSIEVEVVDPDAPGLLDRLRARWGGAGRGRRRSGGA
jgi:hypothetical protein